jgi:hypothetical protein
MHGANTGSNGPARTKRGSLGVLITEVTHWKMV